MTKQSSFSVINRNMNLSIILSTFNQPQWLRLTLCGYGSQFDNDFEIVIADDGSNDETRALINDFKSSTSLNIKHIWHPDNGFQKCRILNRAIEAADGDYLIFSDGDCIPREDFVEVHKKHSQKGYFLSGGYFKLPLDTSNRITEESISSGECFGTKWLKAKGVPNTTKLLKLTRSKLLASILNTVTPTKRTWNGHNASCWRSDALKVNGFDERMKYGGEDVEFGYRLVNSGLAAKQIRYLAPCLHLDHPRGYVNEGDLSANLAIRKSTLNDRREFTNYGIINGDNLQAPETGLIRSV